MRSVTVAGSLVMAAATALFALGDSFQVLVLARIGQGVGSAIAWSAGLAWLAARSAPERRGSAIGLANASATGGMIAGPLLGGAVAGTIGLRATFLGAAGVSVALAGWGLTEADARAHAGRESSF